MSYIIQAESFVLFADGKSYPAMLPTGGSVANGIDFRFSKAIKKAEFIVEWANAKKTNLCEPDTWHSYSFQSVCKQPWDGHIVLENRPIGGCKVTIPCIEGDFLRVRPAKEGGDTDGILVSLAIR